MPLQRVNPEDLPQPSGLYSMVSIVPPGSQIAILSGQLGHGPTGEIPEDPQQECLAVFNAVETACRAIDASPMQIVFLRTLLVGREQPFAAARAETFGRWFGSELPPSSTLAFVSGLADPQARCEVEAMIALE